VDLARSARRRQCWYQTIRTDTALGARGVDLGLNLLLAHGRLIQGIEPLERIAQAGCSLRAFLDVFAMNIGADQPVVCQRGN